jgi:hypothetical protein
MSRSLCSEVRKLGKEAKIDRNLSDSVEALEIIAIDSAALNFNLFSCLRLLLLTEEMRMTTIYQTEGALTEHRAISWKCSKHLPGPPRKPKPEAISPRWMTVVSLLLCGSVAMRQRLFFLLLCLPLCEPIKCHVGYGQRGKLRSDGYEWVCLSLYDFAHSVTTVLYCSKEIVDSHLIAGKQQRLMFILWRECLTLLGSLSLFLFLSCLSVLF